MKHGYIEHWLTIALFVVALLFGFGAAAPAQEPNQDEIGAVELGPTAFAVVLYQDIVFPDTLTIAVGDTVVWINIDESLHEVNSGTRQNPTTLFKSGDIDADGGIYSYTFTTAGIYPYFCDLQDMTGLIIVQSEVITGVSEGKPEAVVLYQNVPNPFNSETMLSFDLNRPGDVTLSVYTVTGQKVWEQTIRSLAPGHHSIRWEARDASGMTLSGGIYLYTLTYEGTMAVRRMLYMK